MSVFKDGFIWDKNITSAAAVAHTDIARLGRGVRGVLVAFVHRDFEGKTWLYLVLDDAKSDFQISHKLVEDSIREMLPSWMNIGFLWLSPNDLTLWWREMNEDMQALKDKLKRYEELSPDVGPADTVLEQLKKEDEPTQEFIPTKYSVSMSCTVKGPVKP